MKKFPKVVVDMKKMAYIEKGADWGIWGKMKFYFYPLNICAFGIHCYYKTLEVSLIWYNLIIDWGEE